MRLTDYRGTNFKRLQPPVMFFRERLPAAAARCGPVVARLGLNLNFRKKSLEDFEF